MTLRCTRGRRLGLDSIVHDAPHAGPRLGLHRHVLDLHVHRPKPKKQTTYFCRLGKARSPKMTLKVRPAVALQASATSVAAGGGVKFSGTTTPLLPGAKPSGCRPRRHGAWSDVGQRRLRRARWRTWNVPRATAGRPAVTAARPAASPAAAAGLADRLPTPSRSGHRTPQRVRPGPGRGRPGSRGADLRSRRGRDRRCRAALGASSEARSVVSLVARPSSSAGVSGNWWRRISPSTM